MSKHLTLALAALALLAALPKLPVSQDWSPSPVTVAAPAAADCSVSIIPRTTTVNMCPAGLLVQSAQILPNNVLQLRCAQVVLKCG